MGSEEFLTIDLKIDDLKKDVEKAISLIQDIGSAAENSGKQLDSAMAGGSTGTMRQQLASAKEEVAMLTAQFNQLSSAEKDSASGKELLSKLDAARRKAGQLRDAMDDANRSISGLASDTRTFDALNQGLNVAISTAGAFTGSMEMLGMAQEDVQEVQAKLQASLAISNALTVIQNNLQKESALMLGIRSIKEAAAATAISIKTAAEGKGIIVTYAATAAQGAFNLVAKANPYVLLATGIIAVVATLVGFTKKTKEAKEVAKKLNDEVKMQQQYFSEMGGNAAKLEASYHSLQNKWKQLKTTSEKNQFIKDNAKAFDSLGLKVRNTADAESVLVKNTDKVIQSFRLRAQAMAAENMAIKEYEKYYKKITEKSVKNGDYFHPYKEGDISDEEAKEAGVRTKDQRRGTRFEQGVSRIVFNDYTDEEKAAINANRRKKAQERRKQYEEDAKADLDSAINAYDDMQKEANTKLSKYDFTLGAGESNVVKSGGSSGKGGKTDNTAADMKKASEEYAKLGENLIDKYEEAKVGALKDGEDKVLAELALQHQKELDAIEKERDEMIKAKTEASGNVDVELDTNEEKMFTDRAIWATQAYQKSVDDIKATRAQQMNEYFASYGSFVQQMQSIADLYNDQIEKATTEGEKLSIGGQMMSDLENVKQQYSSSLETMSTDSLQTMLDKLEAMVDANKAAFTPSQMEAYKAQIEALSQEIGARNPFTAMKSAAEELKIAEGETLAAIDELISSQTEVAEAQAEVAKANASNDGSDAATQALSNANNRLAAAKEREAKASKEVTLKTEKEAKAKTKLKKANNEALQSINKLISSLKDVGDAIGGMAGDIIGIVTQIGTTVTAGIEGMQAASETGAEAIKAVERASVILAIIGAALQVVTKIFNLVKASHDNALQDDIEAAQKQIEKLEYGYKQLEKQVEKTFSSDKARNINQQISNLQQQIALINRQINDENQKKDSDNDAIDDYKKSIQELKDNIAELKEDAVDAIFGEDVTSSIANFADAYIEAWSNGESKVKSAKQVVKDLMKQMVTESIKAAIQSSDAMENIRKKLQEFYADKVLTGWEQNYIYNMANDLQKKIDTEFAWADSLMDETKDQSSTSGGFATASQDSVDELNGRFTAIQMTTANIDEKMMQIAVANTEANEHLLNIRLQTEESVSLARESNGYLASIERNTRELYSVNEKLDKIEQNTRTL